MKSKRTSDVMSKLLLSYCLLLLPVVCCTPKPAWSEQFSIGYIASNRGAAMAEAFGKLISLQTGITVSYDYSARRSVDGRLPENAKLTDLVCLYGGSDGIAAEIADLAAAGKLRSLDGLVDRSITKDSDLMQVASYNSQVWAVPIRIVVPYLVVPNDISRTLESWADVAAVAQERGLVTASQDDLLFIWLTMGLQSWERIPSNVSLEHCFQPNQDIQAIARQLAAARVDEFEREAPIRFVNSDYIADRPGLLDNASIRTIPTTGKGFLCSAWSWYIGVSSTVSDDRLGDVRKVLAVVTSQEFQRALGAETYSAPLLPKAEKESEEGVGYTGEANRLKFLYDLSRSPSDFEKVRIAFLATLSKP